MNRPDFTVHRNLEGPTKELDTSDAMGFLDSSLPGDGIKAMTRNRLSKRDIDIWRAYIEILNERVPLVDHWDDGRVTWQPRVVRKLLWHADVPDTMRNRSLAYDWLMQHRARFV
jgi:hypothetical protein